MHQNIQKIYDIANKPSRKILGLMSGTSLDGLDIALCEIENAGKETKVKLLHATTALYDNAFRAKLLPLFSTQLVSLEQLCLVHPWLGLQHAQMINKVLAQWGIASKEIDLIASHGQTIYHAPKSLQANDEFGSATLQIGEADHIATHTGIITISDFRQKHIAAGGEGAPLAVYGDYLMFADKFENRLLLNIGGIANFTYLAANASMNQVISSDTGPGNTIMDAYMREHFKESFDKDGAIAKQGNINNDLLKALKANSFFNLKLPKTVGPELFNLAYLKDAQVASSTLLIDKADVLATLNRFTAETIVDAIKLDSQIVELDAMYISGGGLHNTILFQHLVELMPSIKVVSFSALGMDPDAKEAVLFALLANEAVAGTALQIGASSTKNPTTMGKISFPN